MSVWSLAASGKSTAPLSHEGVHVRVALVLFITTLSRQSFRRTGHYWSGEPLVSAAMHCHSRRSGQQRGNIVLVAFTGGLVWQVPLSKTRTGKEKATGRSPFHPSPASSR